MANNLVDEHEGNLLQLSTLSFVRVDRSTRAPWVASWYDDPLLSNDRLTKNKFGMLYVKPKVQLFWVGDNNYLLKLGCNWKGNSWRSEKKGKNKSTKTLTIKTWYLDKMYGMCHTNGNRWTEYQQSMDLLDRPSNM